MKHILLTTFKARYIHTAAGLYALAANTELPGVVIDILELDIKCTASQAAAQILEHKPDLIGLGVYIWNKDLSLATLQKIRRQQPKLPIILGGPEVGEDSSEDLLQAATACIQGEAEEVFPELARHLLLNKPVPKLTLAKPAQLEGLNSPVSRIPTEDLGNKLVYIETSRGCPYQCEYCQSAGDAPIRLRPLPQIEQDLLDLFKLGARRLKFLDRTFNALPAHACAVCDLLLKHSPRDTQVHFELYPSRIPPNFQKRLHQFPPGRLRLEVGIQSFNDEVCQRIKRTSSAQTAEEHLRFLVQETHAHVHADLIAGLPGETLESMGDSFNKLVDIAPHEIQIGRLKKLRGTPIGRHDEEWSMIYESTPPYRLLSSKTLSAEDLSVLEHMGRVWDQLNHRFPKGTGLLLLNTSSPFEGLRNFTRFTLDRFHQTHGLPLVQRLQALYDFLSAQGTDLQELKDALKTDYEAGTKRETPRFLL